MLNKKTTIIVLSFIVVTILGLTSFFIVQNSGNKINKNININQNQNVNKVVNTNQNKNINQNINQNNTNINKDVDNNKKQSPEDFVEEFYDYYFGPHRPSGIGSFEFIKRGNYLSSSFLERIEGDKFRSYFLTCAQENPNSTREYENVTITKNTALVLASHLYYRDKQILVELKLKDNRWEIDDIQCLPMLSKYRTPKNIAKEFYHSYLGGYERKFTTFKHIKNGGFLTGSFIKKIEDSEHSPPLLMCSQEVPINSEFDEAKITGNTASVLTHHFYSNDKEVLAELKFELKDSEWKINDIVCLK